MDNNWRKEKDIKKLIRNPQVQAYIEGFENSSSSMSAEEFLGKMDTTFSPIPGLSLVRLADTLVPIYKKIGIKTGKSKSSDFAFPIQEVVVKLLCSLMKNNYPLQQVYKATSGSIVIAKVPSSIWTFGGKLVVALQDMNNETKVNIDVKIEGQWYDWGESKSVIKKILADLNTIQLDLN